MKFKQIFKSKYILATVWGWLVLIFFTGLIVYAGNQYYKTTGSQMILINEFSSCKQVTNYGSQDIFIPTNTSTEWSTFLANKPSYVSLAECYLVNNAHTATDCTNSGGSVVNSGSNYFCKFNNDFCPSGWTQYNSWSETVSKSCAGNNLEPLGICPSGCDTGSHVFSDVVREVCRYYDNSTYAVTTCYSQQCVSYPCGASCSIRRGCRINWCNSCVSVPYPCGGSCQYGNGVDCTANTGALGCY